MDFEQMKKIWDEQNKETLYVINEEAVHMSVRSKKKKANKLIGINEIGLMLINVSVAIYLIVDSILDNEGWFDLIGAGVLLFTVGYIYRMRTRRKQDEVQFDRTILGELDHAIANTFALIRMGNTMVYWYMLPVSVYVIFKMIYVRSSLGEWVLMCGLLILGVFIGRFEIKRLHIPRLKRLEAFRLKLLENVQ